MTRYKLLSDKIAGQIIATYANGYLCDLNIELATPLTDYQFIALFSTTLAYKEDGIKGNWLKVEETPTNVKIAMFCESYAYYNRGLKYKVGKAEAGKLTSLLVTKQLLTTYFTSKSILFTNKWSIHNYAKYFNELRAESRGAYAFPNYYDSTLVRSLSSPQYSSYIKHLRAIGVQTPKQ